MDAGLELKKSRFRGIWPGSGGSARLGVQSIAGVDGVGELLAQADELPYQAKRGGRDRVEYMRRGDPEKPALSAAGR